MSHSHSNSNNSTTSPTSSRRGPLSHLRQLSRNSFDKVSLGSVGSGPRSPDTVSVSSNSTVRNGPKRIAPRTCTVAINESLIPTRDEVLLNLELLGGDIKPGSLMSIVPAKSDQDRTASSNYGSTKASLLLHRTNTGGGNASSDDPSKDPNKRYIFVVKDMSKEVRARNPAIEVLVAKHVGDAFGMRKGTQVTLAPVDDEAPAVEASHVELTFKDMYLSRSDMWRLAVSDLVDRTVYKGQIVFFMGTIKATVATVYVDGHKAPSAFFGRHTRPIFRSESARYVLFIQMAREMWDFDSDGSGEIMFYKVVNGFLPALFKKWAMLQVKHLVTIVLFARVEYDTGINTNLSTDALEDDFYTGYQTFGDRRPYKDFYRVVVSEMASGEWTTILHQLKREFNIFRKDISLFHLEARDDTTTPVDASATASRVKAHSSLAMYGNFLEAITMASSQYATDYIDRDLLRTGISIAVISPGSGVFEVDYENLRRTTEALVGNGIGIDLICIPKIPLHSVPLFRYRNPHYLGANQQSRTRSTRSRDSTPKQPTPLVGSYSTMTESLSPSRLVEESGRLAPLNRLQNEEWSFALPQWLHVSYWTGKSEDALSYHGITLFAPEHSNKDMEEEEFTIRCRLYDLQMRSVLETNEIETPPLHTDPKYPDPSRFASSVGHSSSSLHPTSTPSSSHNHHHRKPADGLYDPVYGLQKFVPERLTKSGEKSLWKGLQAFDESRARLPPTRGFPLAPKAAHDLHLDGASRRQLLEDTAGLFGTSLGDKKHDVSLQMLSSSYSSTTRPEPSQSQSQSQSTAEGSTAERRRESTAAATATAPHSRLQSSAKAPKFMRQISLGQKGFGIAAPKTSLAEVRTEHVSAHQTAPKTPTPARVITPTTPGRPSIQINSPRIAPKDSMSRLMERSTSNVSLTDHLQELTQNTPSRPILIKPGASNDSGSQLRSGSHLGAGSYMAAAGGRSSRLDEDRDVQFSKALRQDDQQKMNINKLLAGAMPELPTTLSPTTAMAPWLVVLNPSNPDINKVNDTILFSRWQHVFPRPSEMRVMQWKSLSAPASVPLTTEYFPTKAQLDTEFQRQPYNIAQNLEDDLTEEPKLREDFLRELISARFAHGFQVVVGPNVAKAFGQKLMKIADVFSRDHMVEDGTSLFMGVGNTIHQLSCVNGTEVEVNIFVRKPTEPALPADQHFRTYKPAIRTYIEPKYENCEIDILTPKPEKNWNYIDSYLAGHTDEMTENLRFWRARFVLIPMSSRPYSTSKSHHMDNDEEIRLEGIKRLAQTWQKNRYMPPSERQFQSAGQKKARDPNPLDIVYKTEDSSVVIAAEMETLPLFESVESTSRRGQLVSNRERFSKSNFNISTLAEAIQQPVENGGVRMQNRRWHLRLHYNCFIGSDMTTWLLDNFEDLESRDEAVELGNSLMVYDDERPKDGGGSRDPRKERGRGIFVHVERRHPFRDGQYFYQIANELAKPHPAGWLNIRKNTLNNTGNPSVPSTPLAEQTPRDSPRTGLSGASRPSSLHEEASPTSGATTPTPSIPGGKRAKVVLSKMMKYDVDPRRKSYRPERINLHYDRLHNPDNCYHIRIDWMNVTAKLIEDAVKSWAAIAAQHGLRLVEVPIAEACAISDVNPFRKPYHIKLSLPPPTKRPVTYYDPNSFAPQSQPGRHYYQRALLRKFDFVLDMEAASHFPANVDVSYSWGQPDFKYSQYIHRSGMVIVEIRDDGDFLLLANRLYSNRAAAFQQVQQPRAEPLAPNDRISRLLSTGGGGGHGSLMSEPTPISSPLFRPVLFSNSTSSSQTGNSNGGASSIHRERDPPPVSSPRLGSMAGRPGMIATHGDPEILREALMNFCADEEALEAFYKETLEKGAAVSTPGFGASGMGGGGESVVSDAAIPSLGLPPGVLGLGERADSRDSQREFGGGPPSLRVGTPGLAGGVAVAAGECAASALSVVIRYFSMITSSRF
ncbi:Vacuolar membrane-associated protein iml1 [Apiospora marii]|uniref:Vacuolar membrane-associated protein IML1 n=1 Tax=Apiospora marii TaxID=335849 RepID=A0ABR1SEC4_9PEZI